MWGIHNDQFGAELIDLGFISVGWSEMGDLRAIGDNREAMKVAVQRTYPDAKKGAIPLWAGILRRFAFGMQPGDVVISPYKADSTLNFGVIEGLYEYLPDADPHPHRRRVRWLRTGVARGLFPQAALYEVGSAVTLFQVKKNAHVFRAFLESSSEEEFAYDQTAAAVVSPEDVDAETATVEDEPSADRIDQHTRDFIIKALLQLTHEEFEYFVADLLRAVGYQARVTPYSSDGGIDVIAHKDPLGLEPPIIKVQCKHTSAQKGRPDVQHLVGTLSSGELGLYVTLGAYSKDAMDYERERQNLRLFTGADVTRLTLEHYKNLPSRWRTLMPLRSVLVVDQPPELG